MELDKELKKKIINMSGQEAYDIGIELYEDEAVLDLRRNSRGFNTRVANDKGRFEEVRIVLKKNYFSSKCSCSAQGNAICEHAVAAFCQFYEEFPDELLAIVYSEHSIKNIPGAFLNKKEQPEEKGKDKTIQSSTALQQYPLDKMLNQLSNIQSHLVLYYETEGFPRGESKWDKSEFTVELHTQEKIYSGSNIKGLVETGSSASCLEFIHFSPQDQQIMQFFASKAELNGSLFSLNASDVGTLFHSLIGFKRLYTRNSRINIHNKLAELVFLTKKLSEEDKYMVEARLKVDSSRLLPTKDINLISTSSGYWLGIEADYWWLPTISSPNWLHSFINSEPAIIDPESYSQLKNICDTKIFPVIMTTTDDSKDSTVKMGKTIPVFTLDWRKKSLTGRLEFLYKDIRVPLYGKDLIWTGKEYISRNAVEEEKTVKRLQRIGFAPTKNEPELFRLMSSEKGGKFLDTHLPKLTKKWEIYYSIEFDKRKQSSGDMKVQIQTKKENFSWFELDFSFFTKSGGKTDWSNILKAIEENKNYVYLNSGGLAKITPEIRKVITSSLEHAITDDAIKKTDEPLKFSYFSSIYMASLLEDSEFKNVGQWQKLKDYILDPKSNKQKMNISDSLKETLREYQLQGAEWMKTLQKTHFHGILADEMGLGKTIQTLALFQDIKRENIRNKKNHSTSLVVCPSSLVENWHEESMKFTPDLKSVPIFGTKRLNKIENLDKYDIAITSYALIRRDIEQYEHREFEYIILDEAQHIKNPTTANSISCKTLKARHRLILTGTPVENSIKEVWSLFDFLLPGMLGNPKQFQERFEKKMITKQRKEATKELADTIKPFMLRRKKAEVCTQLPPKIEQIIYCELSNKQKELYKALTLEAKEMLKATNKDGVGKHRFEILAHLMRLRQICCHPELLPESYQPYVKDMSSSKMELLQELVLESIDSEHRILLFSQFTSFLAIFRKWLEKENISYEYLDGSTKNRLAKVKNFNKNEKIPIFLLSLKAGGTGLNLTGADTVIHYDQWWNPMVEDQATDRSHRIGQTKQVSALKLVTKHTVEEKIVQLQDSKRELFDDLMAGVPTKMGQLKAEDLK
ncbi:MAG: DEAD/DEAH box helicase [Verrucomicrobiota bacterium]|nr:DEAD/DEAH box helicase [Verrucomicrobiota bacterium]